MNKLTIALTGHRPKDIDGDYTLTSPTWKWVAEEIEELFMSCKPEQVISGMALGVDMLGAQIALNLGIPLIAAVPFKGQESNWPDSSKVVYNRLLEQATKVHYVTEEGYYANYLFQKRNEWMVDQADLMCAVWKGRTGGTANCVKYALRKQVPVWRIDPSINMVGRFNGLEIVPRSELGTEIALR